MAYMEQSPEELAWTPELQNMEHLPKLTGYMTKAKLREFKRISNIHNMVLAYSEIKLEISNKKIAGKSPLFGANYGKLEWRDIPPS